MSAYEAEGFCGRSSPAGARICVRMYGWGDGRRVVGGRRDEAADHERSWEMLGRGFDFKGNGMPWVGPKQSRVWQCKPFKNMLLMLNGSDGKSWARS